MSDTNTTITYQSIQTQNRTLYNSIQNMIEIYSTDNNRKLYKSDNYEKIRGFSVILFFIYYTLLLIFILLIVFKQKMKWYIKLGLIVVFSVYPFLIYYIENFIYQVIAYITYNT